MTPTLTRLGLSSARQALGNPLIARAAPAVALWEEGSTTDDYFLSASRAFFGRGSSGWASFTACSAAVTASALRPVAASTSASTRYPSHSSGRQPTPARAASSASGSRPSRRSRDSDKFLGLLGMQLEK